MWNPPGQHWLRARPDLGLACSTTGKLCSRKFHQYLNYFYLWSLLSKTAEGSEEINGTLTPTMEVPSETPKYEVGSEIPLAFSEISQ